VPTTNGRKGNGERRGTEGRREGKVIGQEGEVAPSSWGLWIRQYGSGGKRDRQGGELGRPRTFFHFKHWTCVSFVMFNEECSLVSRTGSTTMTSCFIFSSSGYSLA